MSQATHLLHIQDLVLHLLEGTLRLGLLQPGLHQLSLQLQDGLLRVSRGSLLQQDMSMSTAGNAELQMPTRVCVCLMKD